MTLNFVALQGVAFTDVETWGPIVFNAAVGHSSSLLAFLTFLELFELNSSGLAGWLQVYYEPLRNREQLSVVYVFVR